MSYECRDVITRLHPNAEGCFVQLGVEKTSRFGNQTELRPLDRYFQLKLDHPNYTSIFQVAMHAAFLEKRIVIRSKEAIDPVKIAEIDYLYVEFEDE